MGYGHHDTGHNSEPLQPDILSTMATSGQYAYIVDRYDPSYSGPTVSLSMYHQHAASYAAQHGASWYGEYHKAAYTHSYARRQRNHAFSACYTGYDSHWGSCLGRGHPTAHAATETSLCTTRSTKHRSRLALGKTTCKDATSSGITQIPSV